MRGNHYHLLVETLRGNLSLGRRQLNGLYCRRFNRAHARCGHLFQARYRAILVEKERHLLARSRYIVLNPVRAGICQRPRDWPWSSYRATLGEEERAAFLPTDWLLGQFGSSRKQAVSAYRAYVERQPVDDPWSELRGGLFLASDEFIARHARGEQLSPEIPFEQRVPLRPPLAEILTADHDEAILTAYEHGYRLREIVLELGVHPSTVSRRLRAIERRRLRECKT